ncbi:type II toxin-antitoxin system RelE/ParE family toxin [Geitlerinema sp. CS-897]|nr:type II toxin-antitoxin system RelE/ParE family toxin [Geitlerinema sp. CS-897]
MPDNPRKLEFTSEFKRNIRTLVKRYRNIRQDVEPLLDRLQAGEILGDRVSGTGYEIYKVRLKNSDVRKGKSGGYRLIYYVKLPTAIVLVTIYSKSDRSDIPAKEIAGIVKRHSNDRRST